MASCATLAELIAWTCGRGPGHCTLPFLLRARVAGSEGWGDSGPGTGQGRRTAGAGVTQHLSCSLAASWEDLAGNHFLSHPLPEFCPLGSPPQLWGCRAGPADDPFLSGAPRKPQVQSAREWPAVPPALSWGLLGFQSLPATPGPGAGRPGQQRANQEHCPPPS